MNHQPALFHDSILDAIGAAVQAAGGIKQVAHRLWPSLSQDIASARLRSSLNPDHAQKLCPLELMQIAKLAYAAGDDSIARYVSTALGYGEPERVTREERVREIDEEIRDTLEQLKAAMQRRDRVLKVV